MENNKSQLHPLLRRAMLFLESEEWGTADDYCERVLDEEPENAYAYVIKLMARVRVSREEDIALAKRTFRGWNSYETALRFADNELRERLEGYLFAVEERIRQEELRKEEEERERERIAQEKAREAELIAEENRKAQIYNQACDCQKSGYVYDLNNAMSKFRSIIDYKDSRERIAQCEAAVAKAREDRVKRIELQEKQKKKKTITVVVIIVSVILAILAVVLLFNVAVTIPNNKKAEEISSMLVGMSFNATYMEDSEKTSGGAISLYTKMTECDETYSFEEKGIVEINRITRYDEEPFIINNGERQWDSENTFSGSVRWSGVKVSTFGKITLMIAGKACEIKLDTHGVPATIEINDVIYHAE